MYKVKVQILALLFEACGNKAVSEGLGLSTRPKPPWRRIDTGTDHLLHTTKTGSTGILQARSLTRMALGMVHHA